MTRLTLPPYAVLLPSLDQCDTVREPSACQAGVRADDQDGVLPPSLPPPIFQAGVLPPSFWPPQAGVLPPALMPAARGVRAPIGTRDGRAPPGGPIEPGGLRPIGA